MPKRSKGGKRKLLRIAFVMGGVVKGNAVAAIAGVPKSSCVSCKGVGVSVITEAVDGVCGIASVRAAVVRAVGSDREEAASNPNRARVDKLSEAGEGKVD